VGPVVASSVKQRFASFEIPSHLTPIVAVLIVDPVIVGIR